MFVFSPYRLESEKLGFEAERDSLQNTLDMTNSLTAQKEKDIEQCKLQVSCQQNSYRIYCSLPRVNVLFILLTWMTDMNKTRSTMLPQKWLRAK